MGARYGLLQPIRSEGGFRLYTAQDGERVARMKRGLDEGLSAAEAARRALAQPRPSEGLLEDARRRLLSAVRAYDEAALHAVLDEALAGFALETVLRELILPALREIGDQWERGELEIGAGALREQPRPRAAARARTLLGPRRRAAGDPRLRARRAPRHRPHRLRPHAPLARLADRLPRRRHAARNARRAIAATEPRLVVVASIDSSLLETEAAELGGSHGELRSSSSGAGASEELCARLGSSVSTATSWARPTRSPAPDRGVVT